MELHLHPIQLDYKSIATNGALIIFSVIEDIQNIFECLSPEEQISNGK